MIPRIYLLLLALGLSSALTAQEQLGLRLSNYAGINSTVLNPAYHGTTPLGWDANLVEGALYLNNNYAYLRSTSISRLIRERAKLEYNLVSDFTEADPPGPNNIVVDFYRFNRSRNLYAMGSVMGPSFFVRLGPRHAIGLLTRARFVASARSVSNGLSYYQYNPKPFFQDINVPPFRMAAAGWGELGFNYAYTQPTYNGQLTAGITIKALQASEGAYWRNEERFFLQKLPNDSLASNSVNFSYAYAGYSLETDTYTPQRNGGGFSVDLGVAYTIEGNSEAIYDWKFGASLVDIGWLNFTENARAHQVTVDNPVAISTAAYLDIQGLNEGEEYIEYFSYQILNDSSASTRGSEFQMALPAAFSLQASRSLGRLAYVDAVLVQGFPMGDAALQRGSMLSVVPRFEHRWLEAALPITLYDWRTTRIGLSLRLAFLTIGTEHLGSFISNNDLYGTDFYVGLKVSPFSLGKGDGWGGRRNRIGDRKKRGKVKCYEF